MLDFQIDQLVYFDLETTGLNPYYDQMVQIAAIYNDTVFSEYVTPSVDINPGASQVTSIYFDRETNIMTHHGEPVSHLPAEQVLCRLAKFLREIDNPILVAHNGLGYDFIILYKALISCNSLDIFKQHITGFLDSLPLCRTIMPTCPTYKLGVIYRRLFRMEFVAHDAVEDSRALRDIVISQQHHMEEINHYSYNWEKTVKIMFK